MNVHSCIFSGGHNAEIAQMFTGRQWVNKMQHIQKMDSHYSMYEIWKYFAKLKMPDPQSHNICFCFDKMPRKSKLINRRWTSCCQGVGSGEWTVMANRCDNDSDFLELETMNFSAKYPNKPPLTTESQHTGCQKISAGMSRASATKSKKPKPIKHCCLNITDASNRLLFLRTKITHPFLVWWIFSHREQRIFFFKLRTINFPTQ